MLRKQTSRQTSQAVSFVPKADKRAAAKVPLFDHRVGTGEQLPKRTLSEFAVVP